MRIVPAMCGIGMALRCASSVCTASGLEIARHGPEHLREQCMNDRVDSKPDLGDELGEATGGITGVLVGAGIGSAAGPVGTLIGGIAGALSGWGRGRAVAEAASTLSQEDEAYYREHYDASPKRP